LVGEELSKEYISIDAVHINGVIQDKNIDSCEMCRIQKTNQIKYIDKIKEHFSDKKVWTSHRLTIEPIGLDGLLTLADEVYGKDVTLDNIIHPNKK
jgi:anion-transporting  ArsA/GET3 family ATPase